MASEFALIPAFVSAFEQGGAPVRVGPGDDCAVVRAPRGGRELCLTTDAVVQNVHFTLEHFSLADVGHKALAVNLSDLASMGAKPEWFLCAVAMPRSFGTREVRALARGMAALARDHRIALVGGNFSLGSELSLTITAAGSTKPGAALVRGGARAGDLLYVSGTLGDARAGLEALQRGERSATIARQKRPAPRVSLGLLAGRFASAGIDLSDGLAQDLGHVCDASKVGAVVELARLPLSRGLLEHCGGDFDSARRLALSGGEDYELLLAVPPRRARAFEAACARAGEQVTRVGRLTREMTQVYVSPTGEVVRPAGGFDHFARGSTI